jgi:hypothetical protein
MIDRLILIALRDKTRFQTLRRAIPDQMLDGLTVNLLNWYEVYWNQFDHQYLDTEALLTMMKLRANMDESQLAMVQGTLSTLDQDVDASTIKNVANNIYELAYAGKAGKILADYNNGEEVDLVHELDILTHETKHYLKCAASSAWADEDISAYIEKAQEDAGLKFGIPSFDKNLVGVKAGHNIALAAPTDAGKTSLLCRIAVNMAMQMRNQERPLLYLVNEGIAESITPRVYQTALGVTNPELYELSRAGTLTDKYVEIVGRRDAIRLVNIHGFDTTKVLRIIEAHNPYLVITDMTGRIRSPHNKVGMNDFAQLEEVWNIMREGAAIYDCTHMGTVQVSGEGMQMMHPPLTAMQNSKVGIQTTLDLAIVMGVPDDVRMPGYRGLWTPKNKLVRAGASKTNFTELQFEGSNNTWTQIKG